LPSVPGDTRQRSYLCRVSARQHSTKNQSLPRATWDTRQRTRQGGSPCQVLCRVLCAALSKACLFAECQRHYTRQRTYTGAQVLVLCECYGLDTRQRTSLPSVTLGKVTSRHLFYLFFIFHPHKQKISHIYITGIITNINSQHKHKYPSQT
jgi:hypothetical protein